MGPGRSAALLMVLALAAPESTRALAVPDSLALHPAAAESLISFADHLRRSGEPYAAVTECKRALFLLPHGASPSRAYRCMALAHSELGDSREAISSARRSVATATELS